MGGSDEDKAFGLAGGHALSASEVEKRQLSRAGDAFISGDVGKWSSLRALGQVGNSCSFEDIESILLLVSAAIEPGIRSD